MKKPKIVAPNDDVQNEEHVKREIKKELDRYGWFWWSPNAGMYGKSGVADICAIHHDVFLAIEAKFKDNVPTAMQKAFLLSVETEGGISLLVHDHTLFAYRAFMSAYDQNVRAKSHGGRAPDEIGATMINALQVLTRGFR